MEQIFKPFVINSNICTLDSDIATYETFMDAIAGNTGNSYITWALLKELGCTVNSIEGHHIKNVYSYNFANSENDLNTINRDCSHVILVLQDQIRIEESYSYRLPFKDLKTFISKIKKPLLVAGLGANSFNGFDPIFHTKLDAELIDFLKFLSSACVSIGVRGEFTHDVLKKLGINNSIIIGCPSYYERGGGRKIVKPIYSDDLRIGTSIGVKVYGKGYVYLQDKLEENLIKQICYAQHGNFDLKELRLLAGGKYRIFSSVSDWQKDLKNKVDFYIGTRVHGSMVAMNCGIPTVVMNGDSRSREMCEYMNIPHHPELYGCGDIEKIMAICDYEKMNTEYDRKLEKFIAFLKSNDFYYNPLNEQTDNVHLSFNESYHISQSEMIQASIKYLKETSRLMANALYSKFKNLIL